MATKPKAAPATAPLSAFEPEAFYRVKLSKSVRHGAITLRPGASSITVTGAIANQFKDAIASAERV